MSREVTAVQGTEIVLAGRDPPHPGSKSSSILSRDGSPYVTGGFYETVPDRPRVPSLEAGGISYSLDIDIAPTAEVGAYTCKAVVKDLETGKVVVAPNIALLANTSAAITSGDGDLVAEFRVSVDSKASRAIAELKVSRGGRVVSSQKSSVAVR